MLTSNKAQITLVWGYEKFLPSDFKLPDFPWAFPDIHGICLANPPPAKKKSHKKKAKYPCLVSNKHKSRNKQNA